jgi:hypothetical protein
LGEPTYIDLLARELASESCFRCTGMLGWKTAALMYEGLEWKYYYCYQCRSWSKRHSRYRYVVAPVGDKHLIALLVRQLESHKEMLEAHPSSASWLRRKISSASNFFQRYLP